jgi:hypothetical protein
MGSDTLPLGTRSLPYRVRWVLGIGGLLVALPVGLLWSTGVLRRAVPKQAPARAALRSPSPRPATTPARRKRSKPLDVTFFVAADTHVGFGAKEQERGRDPLLEPNRLDVLNIQQIRAMNGLPGRAYPRELGGRVERPRALFVAGDLTDTGGLESLRLFRKLYAPVDQGGLLEFSLYEMAGNHDRTHDWTIREQIARQRGYRFYAVTLDDLEIICLDEAPDDAGLAFLDKTLGALSSEIPIIVILHYPLAGPFSENNWFGKGDYRQRFAEALEGRRVLGIFHGHYHASTAYIWRGYDVYNVGSPMYLAHSFAVVHVEEHRMQVASFNYAIRDWWWWHDKPILGAPGSRRAAVIRVPKDALRPDVAP